MSNSLFSFSSPQVAAQFSKAADTYDKVAFVQQEIGRRLLSRLEYMRLKPQAILDIGAGTGTLTQALQNRYPESTVVGLDMALGMAQALQKKTKLPSICADMHRLPFASNTFDLIVSNCTLQWSTDPKQFFSACQYALKPNGVLLLTTFGPDTLKELRTAFQQASNTPHVHDFMDMHELGDCCLKLGFLDPVLDREDLTVFYQKLNTLLKDLKKLGATNQHPNRKRGLMGKQTWQKMFDNYSALCESPDKFPVTYEVLYCHALKKSTHPNQSDIEITTCSL
jgi:malonyl-CoA O-methyltransferase